VFLIFALLHDRDPGIPRTSGGVSSEKVYRWTRKKYSPH